MNATAAAAEEAKANQNTVDKVAQNVLTAVKESPLFDGKNTSVKKVI